MMLKSPADNLSGVRRLQIAQAWVPTVLKPLLDPMLADLIQARPEILFDLAGQYGSPLNIVWPRLLQKNVDAFRRVLDAHKLRYCLFYGAKVSKSQALVQAAVEAGIGVDVSSVHELRDALRAGAHPRTLCATGPAKTWNFHAELIRNNVLMSVDSIQELTAIEICINAIAPAHKCRILLRYRPISSQTSRFGMDGHDMLHCLHRLSRPLSPFALEGFHFHLSGYDCESRVDALREVTQYVQLAMSLGLRPTLIDIGGGLPVRYVDPDEYAAYLQCQNKSDYRHGKVPTAFYPYGTRSNAETWLQELLSAPCIDGLSVADYFSSMDMMLAIEPGRSLADQAAISVFRINRVKPLADGCHVIFVEGSSFSACETWFASEFLVNPLLIRGERQDARKHAQFSAYIAGHSCLDEDILSNRLIAFPVEPAPGDLLVYANTAAYQMDLLENEFHRHPMPRRIAVTPNAAGGLDISPDV